VNLLIKVCCNSGEIAFVRLPSFTHFKPCKVGDIMDEEKELLKRMKKNFDILEVGKDWKTVDYPENKVGTAEIKKDIYEKGNFFLMEGTGGYDMVYTGTDIPITQLKIKGETVMVDDPMQWIGMKKLAEHSRGNVLVGGLGLGLVVHHLVKNPSVKRIDVVEFNDDVIKLIKPLLPDGKVHIHKGDIYDERWRHGDYNTVILDVWVREEGGRVYEAGTHEELPMMPTWLRFKTAYPDADVFIWGMRDPKINPAVEKLPSKKYLDFVSLLEQRAKSKLRDEVI